MEGHECKDCELFDPNDCEDTHNGMVIVYCGDDICRCKADHSRCAGFIRKDGE